MNYEHAITYSQKLSTEDLEYIIKKANKLGKLEREVLGVREEEDEEGIHIYFDLRSRNAR